MKSYHRQGECEWCQDEAEVFADGYWLCFSCEEELAEDTPLLSGLEMAELYWGEARLIQGGQS